LPGWPDYVIKPSGYVSGLCYSLLRVEPWETCSFGCIYCYARWYRGPHGPPVARRGWLRRWRRLARLSSRLWPRPWWRLSTLSEPFQRVGGSVPGSVVAGLRAALRREVPLVVNTRSDAVAEPTVLGVLAALAERGLVVVQVSVSPPGFDRLAEPVAPPSWRRLEALEVLAEHGVPVAARVQPLVPGLEEEQLRLAEEALSRGAVSVIAESLRETREGLLRLYRLVLGREPWGVTSWEPYQGAVVPGREGLLHPGPEWRRRMHTALRVLAARHGAAYAPCKDGWLAEYAWPPWRPGSWDCCMAGLASRRRGPQLLLRPTLHEYAWLWRLLGRRPGWGEFLDWCRGELRSAGYVCGGGLEELPGWLRRPLRRHEAMLRRLVEKRAERIPGLLLTTLPGAGDVEGPATASG